MVNISDTVSSKLRNANVLFTILITWGHVAWDLPYWAIGFFAVSVPCFFAISSFLYFKSFDFDHPFQDYKKKVVGRFKSLVIPFLIFNAVGFVVKLLFHIVHPAVYKNPVDDLLNGNVLFYILGSDANGPLWYFLSLYAFVLVAPIMGYIIRLSKYTILLLPLIYWLFKDFSYYSFPYWMVEIFIGTYIAIFYEEIRNSRILDNKFISGGILLLITIIVLHCMEIVDAYNLRVIAPLGFIAIYRVCDILPNALVKFLSPYSILIYCLHIPVSIFVSYIPKVLHVEQNHAIACVEITVITILVIAGVGYILRKNRIVWEIVTGGR